MAASQDANAAKDRREYGTHHDARNNFSRTLVGCQAQSMLVGGQAICCWAHCAHFCAEALAAGALKPCCMHELCAEHQIWCKLLLSLPSGANQLLDGRTPVPSWCLKCRHSVKAVRRFCKASGRS